jgi:hypothetical protein
MRQQETRHRRETTREDMTHDAHDTHDRRERHGESPQV